MPASNNYAALFRAPGISCFFIAGLIARFPLAMMTLGIVIMLSHARDVYDIASLVASTCMLANALIAPQLSRLADVRGQTRVALPASVLATAAFVLLIAAYRLQWPIWTWFACAAAMGAMPHFGAFSRARWSHLYGGTPLLRTAFALESLCEELIWMSGPILVVWCSTRFAPETGLAVAALLFAISASVFCGQTRTEPRPAGITTRTQGKKSVIFSSAVLLPGMALLTFGGFFGILEVASTAFAKQLGVPEKIFYPLTAYAIGSLITGSLYGLLRWQWPLKKQLLVVAVVFFITTIPFFWIDSLTRLTLVCFIAGATCSPSIIIALGLVESLVDKEKLTEGMTWALVSPPIGMAAGFALAGHWVDTFGAAQAFYGTTLFGALTLAVVLVAQPWLQQHLPATMAATATDSTS